MCKCCLENVADISLTQMPSDSGASFVGVLLDQDGVPVEQNIRLTIHLSDDEASPVITNTAPSLGFAVSDGFLVSEIHGGKGIEVITNDQGCFRFLIGENTPQAWYLNAVLPNGIWKPGPAVVIA